MNHAAHRLWYLLIGSLLTGAFPHSGQAALSRPLIRFGSGDDAPVVQATDAQVETLARGDLGVLQVRSGHTQPWPGVTLPMPGGAQDLSPFAYVALLAHNSGTQSLTLHLRVDNPGADGTRHCRTGSSRLEPGATDWIRVELTRTENDRLDDRLFGMRGYPVRTTGPDALDPSRITQVVVFLHQPNAEHQFELLELNADGEYARPTAWTDDAEPFLPFLDTFGQYRHGNWPGKTLSSENLRQRGESEMTALATAVPEVTRSAGWNQYGGWAAGPQLEPTGFFRVQRYAGKWWFVDPEGRLFWSHGIDCVRMLEFTPIDERQAWFLDPPWQQPEFAEFLNPSGYVLKGHYAGRSPRVFSFNAANLHRKYGADWMHAVPAVIHQRLRAWGLNTIANWSDAGVAQMRRTAYTDNLGARGVRNIEGSEGYWGKFPDVFDPAFGESLRRQMAGKRSGSANDPWCLGYFSDNEMSWGDEVSLALAVLASPADQPGKAAFLRDLRTKYDGIAKLNAAWGTQHASWDALATHVAPPPRDRADDDLKAFYTRIAETYFCTVRDTIREFAPQQLYLGCRFAWANPRAAAAAAKFCDVVSYNLYRRSVSDFAAEGAGDVPLLIGEFHFGALDRGMFHTGLVPVSNQDARAQAYSDYVRGALRHSQFVGTHWFQYQDQPTTGRVLDEENYQIGFVDIVDTPYTEMVGASRAVGQELYRLRLGQ